MTKKKSVYEESKIYNQGEDSDEYEDNEKREPVDFSKIWDLQSDTIFYGLKPNKRYQFEKHEEIFISYGERANSYLIVEYGFALPNNPYDFFRVSDISL